jgi:hypothetical protein
MWKYLDDGKIRTAPKVKLSVEDSDWLKKLTRSRVATMSSGGGSK